MYLKGLTTYLIGPIDRCSNSGMQWRKDVTPFLEGMHVKVLNPNHKKFKGILQEDTVTRNEIDRLKQSGQFELIREKFGWIRKVDLRCVDKSDFLIAKIDHLIHMCGSYEEISCANRQKKPIFCFCDDGKKHIPNWLWFMLPHTYLFNNIEEIKAELYTINKYGSTDTRWLFDEN